MGSRKNKGKLILLKCKKTLEKIEEKKCGSKSKKS